jgi:hypothetical protein
VLAALNLTLIDLAIADSAAARFWRQNFLGKENIQVDSSFFFACRRRPLSTLLPPQLSQNWQWT